MKKLLTLTLLVLLFSCGQSPEEKLSYLNGYWEIKEVISENSVTKTYSYNTTIDYIYIENNKGFRKKLQPAFNNQYSTSDDAEGLTIKIENDSLNLYYRTNLANWKETVLSATEEELRIVNQDQVVYVYERYESVEFELE